MVSLLTGLTLGFSASLTPGPLLSLVISTTLARGFFGGMRIAASPLASDLVIVPVSLLVVGSLPTWFTPALSLVGGLFVLWLGYRMMAEARRTTIRDAATPRASNVEVGRGILVNVLSPNPWLFWMTVGSPLLVGYWRTGFWHALAFIASFYFLLIGGQVAVAAAIAGATYGARTGKSTWMNDSRFRLLMMTSAGLLLVFGVILFTQGLQAAL